MERKFSESKSCFTTFLNHILSFPTIANNSPVLVNILGGDFDLLVSNIDGFFKTHPSKLLRAETLLDI